MARARPEGTATHTKAKGFLFPPDNRRWLGIGGVVGAAIVLGAVGSYVIGSMSPSVAGGRATLSPGDVASHHARIDLKCGQCHRTVGGVQSVRCERCHDPSGTDRLLHSAHVLLGSGDRGLADRAGQLECATCHTDHRGRDSTPRTVDDRECATCHQFRSFGGHPEFSVVRAQATAGVGLEFDHDRHVVEAAKAKAETCQSCHEQTPDRRAFQPLTFDRHCASCHLKDGLITGETDFVQPDLLVLPEEIPGDRLGTSRPQIQTNPRGRRKASGLRHRDAWVLHNAARLRRGIDREGDDAERAVLAARIRYLERLERAPATRLVPSTEAGAAIERVRAELAGLDGVEGGRRQRQRLLDRLLVEQELDSSPSDREDAPSQDVSLDRGELDRTLRALRARLAELVQSPQMPAPASETERGARAAALESLLVPCLKCHELNPGRSALASVRIAEPVMRRSLFNHAPHTIQASCESCHGSVRQSKAATDVNVPGVATCQTCHRSSQVKATCSTCHVYHPSSAVRLAVTER